jgi:hypothetical protein
MNMTGPPQDEELAANYLLNNAADILEARGEPPPPSLPDRQP